MPESKEKRKSKIAPTNLEFQLDLDHVKLAKGDLITILIYLENGFGVIPILQSCLKF